MTTALKVPYKGHEYDIKVAVQRTSRQCRITAQVAGHEMLFVASGATCLQAVYRENIMDRGFVKEIKRCICQECL